MEASTGINVQSNTLADGMHAHLAAPCSTAVAPPEAPQEEPVLAPAPKEAKLAEAEASKEELAPAAPAAEEAKLAEASMVSQEETGGARQRQEELGAARRSQQEPGRTS